jgi:hypothetical protein
MLSLSLAFELLNAYNLYDPLLHSSLISLFALSALSAGKSNRLPFYLPCLCDACELA